MMYFYLNNRPFDIFCGDRQKMIKLFNNCKEDGYDPVEISQEKAEALLAEPPDQNTGEEWELHPFPYPIW
jgi:hypothetical protein